MVVIYCLKASNNDIYPITIKELTFSVLKTSIDNAWSFTSWRNNNKNCRIKQIGRSFHFTGKRL